MTVKYVHEASDNILVFCADSVVREVFEELQQGRTEPQEHIFYHVPEMQNFFIPILDYNIVGSN